MSTFHYSDNNFDWCGERRPDPSTALGEYLFLDFTAASKM